MELLILCVKVFFVRILDVSLGTTRTIITVRGQKYLAALIGFIEVFILFVIVREALNTNETSLFVALAYAGGYATGTIIGGFLANRLIETNLTVQIVTSYLDLPDILRNKDYAVTVLNVSSMEKDVERIMLIMEINAKKLNDLKTFVKDHDSKAFIMVNESKYVINGYLSK